MPGLDPKATYLDEWYNLYPPEGVTHGYDVPEELKSFSSPYWYQFPPVHPFVQHFFGIFFFLLWVVTVLGNAIVIFVFLKTPSLRTPSNMLIVALALSDFIMIWSQAPPLFVSMTISKYWAFGHFWCRMYGFFGGIFGCASLWLIIFIGYDRYNVIVNGFSGARLTPLKACAMIAFAFTYSTATIIPCFLGVWSRFTLEGLLNTCSFDYLSTDLKGKSYICFLFTFDYAIPMLFILYFYSFIVKAVVSHERALKEQAKKMNVESLRSNEDDKNKNAEMRIAKIALTAVSLWALAWSPYAFIVMIAQFGPAGLVTPVAAQLPSMLAKVATCFNPVIYAISHPKYKEALARELPCLGIGERDAEKKDDTRTEVSAP